MKIETQNREDHQVQIITEMETQELEGFKRRAARQIANKSKIPGFRPGKAPYDVIKRFFGEEAIQQQAVEMMIDDIYPKILKETEINPSGPGQLNEIISVDPPKFSFIVPLAPVVELPDYLSIRKDYELPSVSDEDVAKVIKNFQRNYATAEPVERPIEKGDLVYINLSADLVHPEEGTDPQFIRKTPLQVIAGEDSSEGDDWPYAGFSNELIGLSAEAEKQIEFTYPQDSPYERMRGKTVLFSVTVQSVKALTLADLDDEFAKTMGEFDTFEDLKSAVRKQVEENTLHEYDDKYIGEIIDEIVAQATIKYPPQVLDHEVEHVLQALEQDLAQRMDLETYFKTRQTDRERFIETEAKPVAKRRLERSLVLDEIARAEKIQVENNELQSAVIQRLMEMQNQGAVNLSKVKSAAARQELTNNIAMDTASRLMSRSTLMRLKAIASGQAEAELEPESGSDQPEDAANEATETEVVEVVDTMQTQADGRAVVAEEENAADEVEPEAAATAPEQVETPVTEAGEINVDEETEPKTK